MNGFGLNAPSVLYLYRVIASTRDPTPTTAATKQRNDKLLLSAKIAHASAMLVLHAIDGD